MTVRMAAQWLLRLVLLAFLAAVLAAVTVLIVIPRATHGVALTVLTGSMTPEIPVGSVVVDRPVDPGTLAVGDIATYQKAPGKDEYITHRVVAIHPETTPVTFTFKGDANRGPDMDVVPATAIRGQVWFHVPYIGAIRDSLQSHGTRGLLLAAVLIGLVGYSLLQVATGLRERGRPQTDSMVVRLTTRSVAGIDVIDVARLLHGTCEVSDGVATLTFTGSPERLRVLGEVLEPHVTRDEQPAPGAAMPR